MLPPPPSPQQAPVQRVVKIRRDYNNWVASETMEDYALRYTPQRFRKWSEWRVANTAFGAASFLVLEAVGLRVPDNVIAAALLADLGEPLMSVTLIMPGDEFPLIDPYDIRETLQHEVDLVIDGGYCGLEPTTVVDLADETPVVMRVGKGDVAPFAG